MLVTLFGANALKYRAESAVFIRVKKTNFLKILDNFLSYPTLIPIKGHGMDYKQYRVEDFVLDETFRKWVLDPDQASRIFWSRWLEKYPQKAATVAQAIELLRQLPVLQDRLSEPQLASITQAIEQGIDRWEASAQEPAKQHKTIPISAYAMARQKLEAFSPRNPRSARLFGKLAVGMVLVLGMLYLAYQHRLQESPLPEIVYEQVVKENPVGQKMTVFLVDGSQIILNAGSKVRFTKPFRPDRRLITLEGEAFFEVAKDSLRPFQVVSGGFTTTAVGTSFNIAAYPEDDRIEVSLLSGNVSFTPVSVTPVRENEQPAERLPAPEMYYLMPGEQISYGKRQQVITKERFSTDKVLAWKEGVIYWEKVDQATVVKTLERWYGVHIEVEGTCATAWEVTAKFNNQSLKSVLTSLSYTMGFDFEIAEDQVLIKYS